MWNSKECIHTNKVKVLIEGEALTSVYDVENSIEWLAFPSPLYKIEATGTVKCKVGIMPHDYGQLKITLLIKNLESEQIQVSPSFPVINNLYSDNGGELSYCFPQMIPAIDSEPVELRQPYSSVFPLQFMSVFQPGGSLTVITQDMNNEMKEFWLTKKTDGTIDLGVRYAARNLLSGACCELPVAIIDISSGDWHSGLEAYRSSLAGWYAPLRPRKDWLQQSFNFRQHFLHHNFGDRVWDSETNIYSFRELIKKDVDAFGGVDYVQLFDWSSDPVHGRVGEYNPWGFLGGFQGLRDEINELQKEGIRVGLYFEGWLLDKRASIALKNGEFWTVKDKGGVPYYQMGESHWHPCPFVEEWRNYLRNAVVRANGFLKADGIYIDQYGYGTQYTCYCQDHGHEVPGNQLVGENQLMIQSSKSLDENIVLLSEYCPTDVGTQYQDGSLTYAKGIINLTRFALPDFKQFVIVRCDEPIGEDLDSVKRIFFNGEGIWLAGPLSTLKWFPLEVRSLIKKTYLLLRKYSDAFSCVSPMPLVDTLHKGVLANQFPSNGRTVWTCLNLTQDEVFGNLLKVKHEPGASYHDAWNGINVPAHIHDGDAFLKIKIGAGDVGCIVQILG